MKTTRIKRECLRCKKIFLVANRSTQTRKFCGKVCRYANQSDLLRGKFGEENFGWKGGRINNGSGYIYKYVKEHPSAVPIGRGSKKGTNGTGYVLEHRLVMEKHLGRHLLSTEAVHHKNGIKTDNRLENLELVPRVFHLGTTRCPHCKKTFKIQ